MRQLARALAAVLFVLVFSRAARAQSGGNFSLDAFRPAMDSRGLVTLNASQILGPRELSFGLVTTWARRPLALTGAGTAYRVGDLVTPTLQAAVGLGHRFELGASLPVRVVSGDVDAQGTGDLGAHAKLRLWDTSHHAFGVALVASLYLPAGHASDRWLGENQLTFAPSLVLDREAAHGDLHLAANLGFRSRKSRSFTGAGTTVTAENELPFGVGASYAISRQKFELVSELIGAAPLGGAHFFPLEVDAGIKLYLAHSSFFTAGVGAGLLGAGTAGSPMARGFVGIVFEPSTGDRDGDGIKDDVDRCPTEPEDKDGFEDSDGCPDPDNDRDGLVDLDDQCPNDPEDKDGIEDKDGCPETEDLDRDRDGIVDRLDKCPDDPEDKDGFEDHDGCPDPDNDKDHILDVDDLCPNEPEDADGFEDQDGCPDPDNDKDGILDHLDKCPNEPENRNGVEDADGCPDRDRAIRVHKGIQILDKIYFETDKAVILPVSFPTLDAVVSVMQQSTDIELLEVQGHADERGSARHNDQLTQARSESVLAYLVEKGIAAGRVTAKGYGSRMPIKKGHNEDAWSLNRRVEFVILKPKP